jgi:hypothetical protein
MPGPARVDRPVHAPALRRSRPVTVRRALALALTMLAMGCAVLPSGYERVETRALQDTGSTALGRASLEALQAHPGQSAFRPLPNGVEALVARMVLAEAATRSLDVQYYIWHDDLTGACSPMPCCAPPTAACACGSWSTTWAPGRTTRRC